MSEGFDLPRMTATEAVARRPTLTDKGRAALGLPPVGDVAVVPLLDLPWLDEQPTLRGDG